MNPQVKQAVILGILFVALIGVLIYQFGGFKGGSSSTTASTSPSTSTGSTGSTGTSGTAGDKVLPPVKSVMVKVDVDLDELIANVETVDFDYRQHREARDPMMPRFYIKSGQDKGVPIADDPDSQLAKLLVIAQNYEVTAIIYNETSPTAMIDNELIVHPGTELVPGIVVQSIEPNRLILRVKDTQYPIELKEQ